MEIIKIIEKVKTQNKNIKMYVDMDGTIIENIYDLEKSFSKKGGYVKKRPIKPIVDIINMIMENYKDIEVNILSCAGTNDMVKEKNNWLDIYMPDIKLKNRIYLVKENGDFDENTLITVKSSYLRDNMLDNDIAILIDDNSSILNESQKILGNKVVPVHVTSLLI